MNISNEDNTVQNEADVDALRNALADGAFGTEGSHDENDALADDVVVKNFISMFGSEGNTPLKAHDWKAYVPSSIYNNPNFWGPIFGVIREETESIYIFDSKKFENEKYVIGYIDSGSYQSKVAYRAFYYPEYKIVGFYENCQLVLKFTSNYISDITARFRNHPTTIVNQNGKVLNPADPMSATFLADGDGFKPINRTTVGGYNNSTADAIASLKYQLTDDDRVFDVRIKQYDTVTNLFSRNTGLLESSAMLDKRAVLVGCGSVGSFVAMQLARSGVGKFVLCDTDTLEIHNICRHQCGFDDLGRYKVDAVKDKILNINPNAEVITYRSIIQRVPEDELLPLLGKDTIIIGGGDNRGSSDWACKLAIKTDSSFVATGCWTRAFAGEIFYWTPGRNLSCYSCAFKDLIDEDRPESHATYFGDDEEKETLAFEPGIAVDIDFVTIIAVKLSLDLLNQDNGNYTPRVIDYLKQYTWVCNTNNTKIGGPKAAMFPSPLWITNNLSVNKDKDCPYCSNK